MLRTLLLSSIAVLLCSIAQADEPTYEIMGGALTQHFTDFGGVSKKFNNKISSDGTLISNPMAAYRIVEYEGLTYTSSAAFAGENSIGEAMVGLAWSAGVKVDHVRLGLAAGGYFQDDQKFRDRDIQPFSMPLGQFGLAPIAGVELQLDVPIENRVYLTLYTLVTPVLATATIGFGWSP